MSTVTHALTTVERLCNYIGIAVPASGSTTEKLLERIINAATAYIENKIQFRVKKTTYTNELYSANGNGDIVLLGRPVISSESVTLQNRASGLNDNSWDTIASNLYVVDYNNGILSGMGSYRFSNSQSGFRVTYTAGYDFDNSTTFLADTTAGDLELAMWKLCKAAYEDVGDGTGTENISSESIGDYSVSFTTTSFDDTDVKSILDQYAPLQFGAGRTPSPREPYGHW